MTDPIPGVVSKQKRGFALLSPEHRKLVAGRGGIMAHLKGTAHTFSPDEAREAGRKGGLAHHTSRGAVGRPRKKTA